MYSYTVDVGVNYCNISLELILPPRSDSLRNLASVCPLLHILGGVIECYVAAAAGDLFSAFRMAVQSSIISLSCNM